MPLDIIRTGGEGGKQPKSPKPPPSPPPQSAPQPIAPTYTPSSTQTSTRNYAEQRQERRQERRESRRDRVEQIRDRNSDLRSGRDRNRLNPIQDSLLGLPQDNRKVLPTFIGERWNRNANQIIATGNVTTVQFGGTPDFTTKRTGYPGIYDDTTYRWTIPAGLSGIWTIAGVVRWDNNSTGHRTVSVLLNGTTIIYSYRMPTSSVTGDLSLPVVLTWPFSEGEYFEVQVNQNSGGNLNLVGGSEYCHVTASFVGSG